MMVFALIGASARRPPQPADPQEQGFQDELDAIERRIAPEWTPLCGLQILDGEGRVVYDRLDGSALGELADEPRAAGVPNPRNAIIEDLANCPPGQRAVYEVEPEPDRLPACRGSAYRCGSRQGQRGMTISRL
jgi:hypothetical protein